MLRLINEMVKNKSGLCCAIDRKEKGVFFSLVDYRNNYFISDDPDKIIEFYNGFKNRDQLIQWMRERPKGTCTIREVYGTKDVIVVIPTADFNGKYAKECRENIFKGLHIVFVESGVGNYYFNYAHNCNVGIGKAMEYYPKWVVISNDDVNSANNSKNLLEEILKEEYKNKLLLLPEHRTQSGRSVSIIKFNNLGRLIFSILRLIFSILNHIGNSSLITKYKLSSVKQDLKNKFGNKYIIQSLKNPSLHIWFNTIYTYYNFEAFGIFSINYLKKIFPLFDETFINAHEDYRVSMNKHLQDMIGWIDYSLYGVGGASLGNNIQRSLRTIAADSYLNFLLDNDKMF